MITALILANAAAPVSAVPPSPASVVAPDPVQLAAARELLDVVLPPAARDATFAQMVNAMMVSMTRGIVQGQGLDRVFAEHHDAGVLFGRFIYRQRMLALADLKAATPALIEAEAQAYARRFETTDLIAIRAFFASPVGQRYRELSTTILSDPAVATWQTELASRSQARVKGEVAKLLEELKPILEQDANQPRYQHS